MRLSISSFVWTTAFRDADLQLVHKVAQLGFDQLEIVFHGAGAVDGRALRQALEAAGITASVAAYCLQDRDVSSSDPGVRAAGLRYLTDAIDFAAEINANVVAGPIAHPPARARMLSAAARAVERSNAIRSLRAIGDHAGEHGIRIGVEQLFRYDSDMFNTAADALDFVSEIGHDHVGLHLDTFHMMLEETSAGDAIRSVGERLVHFHAQESHRGEVGTGQIDWTDVFTALTEIGYQGAITIESFAQTGSDFDALINMWRPWFDDADTFSTNSLAFCRGQLETHTLRRQKISTQRA